MRRSKTQPLKEVLAQYIEVMKFTSKLKETGIILNWENIVGRTIARYTRNIYITDQKLFVEISSAIVRNELLMIKDELLKKLNNDAGQVVITEIIIR